MTDSATPQDATSTPGSAETVTLQTQGAIATVTLNRPEAYNAFSKPMRDTLLAVLQDVTQNADVRVCILKGAGKGFSAGNDLRDGTRYEHVSDLIEGEYLPILELIEQSDKLFIAQVHGSAAGIAAALAMTCDFVTMADDSSVYMAFAAIALIPDGGATYHMMNALGYHHALEAIVEGRQMKADDCLKAGIANRVYAADSLESETLAWAESLTHRAPLALGAAKRVLRSMTGRSFADTVRVEGKEQDALARSKDYQRGVTAFVSRTKPVFEGN